MPQGDSEALGSMVGLQANPVPGNPASGPASGAVPGAAARPRPRLLLPGLPLLPPGVERYRIPGGGSLTLALGAGDRVSVTDREGRQPCEIVTFDADGRPRPQLLGMAGTAPAQGLQAILTLDEEAGARLRETLRRRGLDLAGARAITLFGPESRAGECCDLQAEAPGLAILAAPGGPMQADQQDPPTELQVLVHRALIPERGEPALPEPLAEPRLELRVDRATAQAYEVKAGEYIQVIDVAGRQCSDFQAFTAARLAAGVERPLDATTTRTLMGAAYPAPGLFSKFYDVDQQPLVEVIRDTVGRHDTFGLACTSKYYDDQGYPGHVNCSDNFSGALAPFGVAPRKGWEAINFFFNTGVDAHNAIFLDEPWSRPGDYVLLRALGDLVCCSSACPDDIDPANGWEPSDIHVRVYPERHHFSKAIAYRMTTDAEPELTRETGFHPRTSALTRNFTEYKGFWLPTGFTGRGAIEEYWACREQAVVMDLSPLRKFEVLGPDAEALLQHCLTRDVRRLAAGQVVYTALCYEHGGMIDDGTLFRLGDDRFRWIGGCETSGLWLREQAEKLGYRVWVKSSTDQLHNIAVQGPMSRDILREVVWTPPTQPALDELGWFRFAIGRIGDHNGIPLVVSRTGYTGELGFEVFCHPRHAPEVWDAVWEAGRPHGLAPLGLEALDMLRIECGLIFAGAEFDDQVTPLEAGIGFCVPLKTKADDFIGRAALERSRAHPQRALVGLELEGSEPGAHGDCVHVARAQVGVVTSGTRSPVLAKNIALARLNVEYAEPGTEVEVGKIDGHQKRIPATVVRFPFYDPEKTRVRA